MNFTNDEASEIVSSSLTYGTGGMAYSAEDLAKEMEGSLSLSEICDSTFVFAYDFDYSNTRYEAAFGVDLSYTIECNQFMVPTTASVTSDLEGSYATQRVEGEDEATFTGSISGLNPAESNFTLIGSYSRTGGQKVTVREEKSVTSTMQVDLTSMTISKTSYEILSGAGTYSINGTYNGEAFSFSGNFTFDGGGAVTIYVNGEAYTIDLK